MDLFGYWVMICPEACPTARSGDVGLVLEQTITEAREDMEVSVLATVTRVLKSLLVRGFFFWGGGGFFDYFSMMIWVSYHISNQRRTKGIEAGYHVCIVPHWSDSLVSIMSSCWIL